MPYWVKEDREVTTKFLSDLNEQTAFTALGSNYIEQLKAAMNYSPLFKKESLEKEKPVNFTKDELLKTYAFAVNNRAKLTLKPLGVWDSEEDRFIADLDFFEANLHRTVWNSQFYPAETFTVYYSRSRYAPVAYIKIDIPEGVGDNFKSHSLSSYSSEGVAPHKKFLEGGNFILLGAAEDIHTLHV